MSRTKIALPNGCWCSEPKVSPSNWNSKDASTDRDWFVHYRFYDPLITNETGGIKPHQVVFRGANEFKSLADRRAACKQLISNELDLLKNKGYNPACKKFTTDQSQEFFEVAPSTPFIQALWMAFKKLKGVSGTLTDIKSVIGGVETAAIHLRFSDIPISKVSRKHIKAILERCSEINKRWSPGRHNKYRAYLIKVFKQLVAMEAIDINPIRDVEMQKETRSPRITLTRDQRKGVSDKLKIERYSFWRFLQVFFHSGARETEMMKVQGKHVDLAGQRCLYKIMKRGVITWEWRPIKDIILHLWVEAMEGCGQDDYLFSRGLASGPVSIRPDQITRRWEKYVKMPVDKGGMGIKADVYSLKHSNLDETAAILGIQDASKMAGHTSTVVTMGTYAIGEKDRQIERLKKVGNSFC